MLADAATVPELAARIRAVIDTELAKIERAAAAAPLSEQDTCRLRNLAQALKLASVADPSASSRRAWLRRMNIPTTTGGDDE